MAHAEVTGTSGAPPDDRREVAAVIRDRDERAFRALYRRHTPALYAFALRLLTASADAEDVVQDAWIRAIRRLPDFAWDSTLRTWLTGIVLNCCREHWRRRREFPLHDNAELEEAGVPLGERIDIVRALASLPSGYRVVLVLHDLEGWTHQEIAERLGVEAGTSKSQLSRARAAIRRVLAGYSPSSDEERR